MTTTANRRTRANPLHMASLARWLLLAAGLAICGLLFVYVKNQQHFLGAQTRKVEHQIREMRVRNEVLLAKISQLSSRAELLRKLAENVIVLEPIQDHSIARLIPPVTAEDDGLLRTAANEGSRP